MVQWPCAIAVDVGGTFTDLVMVDGAGMQRVVKVPSTPDDPARGVMAAVDQLADDVNTPVGDLLIQCQRFVHGSTVATNAVLERRLATVGLITTEGFRDALEIRRGIREDQWDHRSPWPPVIVPRHRRLGIAERTRADGSEEQPLDEDALAGAVATLVDEGVESVAISFLHSYADPAHERRAAEICRNTWPGALTTASSDLVPVLGEYARTSTAVVNAGLVPRVGGYLERLARWLDEQGMSGQLLLLASNGGTVPVDAVARRPVDLVLSGPAAVGGALRQAGGGLDIPGGTSAPMVSMEIGGTSCDVAVMTDGAVPVTDGLVVGGYHLSVPAVDVHTIGAGGGTIASIDEGGMLRVGPQGAGADPGPACYGRGGTQATATDAHLVLGRLRSGAYAGGSVTLDGEAAHRVVTSEIAVPLGLEVEEAAAGMLRILEDHLRHAVETITVERGRDPRQMTLVAAGGAGGLHGAAIARSLGCPRLLIPAEAGVFCAAGMLHTDLRRDVTHSIVGRLDDLGAAHIVDALQRETQRLRTSVADEWPDGTETRFEWFVDLRYPGQLWSARVPIAETATDASIRTSFEAEYEKLYGHIQPDGVLDVTAVSVVGHGALPSIDTPILPPLDSPAPPAGHRRCWIDATHGWLDTAVYDGEHLAPGQLIDGPFLIDARTTTVLGGPDARATVGPGGDLLIEWEHQR